MKDGYKIYNNKNYKFTTFSAKLPWLGGDLQTIKNSISYKQPIIYTNQEIRLKLSMNDGSGDNLYGLFNQNDNKLSLPLIILIHGLTGSEQSQTIIKSAAYFVGKGFPVLRLNLRGALPCIDKSKEHYHAGSSHEIKSALESIPDHLKNNGIIIVGESLGGNIVLKYAGEFKNNDNVIGFASICAPIDLNVVQKNIMRMRNFLYHQYLINRMKKNGILFYENDKKKKFIQSIKTIYEYDNLIVAPDNGFLNANDYYNKCSAIHFIKNIKKPALIIHSQNDPWIPVSIYQHAIKNISKSSTVLISDDGGHVGFHCTKDNEWHNIVICEYIFQIIR